MGGKQQFGKYSVVYAACYSKVIYIYKYVTHDMLVTKHLSRFHWNFAHTYITLTPHQTIIDVITYVPRTPMTDVK